jgi:tetratricopeptide (TPR) repeat protein
VKTGDSQVGAGITGGKPSARSAVASPRFLQAWKSVAWPDLASWSNVTLLSLLIALASLPYLNTLLNSFVYDDNTQVLNNPYLHSFRHLPEIFSTTVWSFIGAQGVTNYYRPMMTLGYLVCYRLFGPVAYGFHLANVVLHATVVCMLFAVTLRMFRSRGVACVAAGLFALHPIHTEPVAWIAAVTDLELTFFYLLTFWFFVASVRPDGRRSRPAEVAMIASFVLALLSKEQALTFPLLATVYSNCRFTIADCRLARKEGHPALQSAIRPTFWLRPTAALWLLAAAYLLFRVRFLGALAPVIQIPSLTWYQAVLSALALTGQYLLKLLWPFHLCAFYVFHKSVSALDFRVIGGAGGLVLVGALFLALWRRGVDSHARLASFGFIWTLVTLAPVLNARWMSANAFAERYLYLPSAGFCWVVGWGFVKLWAIAARENRLWRKGLVSASALVAALCVLRVVTRNRDWHDDVTLYTRTLAAEPNAYHIRNNLGAVYWQRGDAENAEREWIRALRNSPDGVIILNNLGLVYDRKREYARAIALFERAMRLKPNYADPRLNLGNVYTEMGLLDRAESELRVAVSLSPLNFEAHNRLGELYLQEGKLGEAEEQLEDSVRSEPNVRGYNSLADVYRRTGDRARAESAYRQAIALNAFDSHAHFGLAAIEAAGGRKAEAIRDYQAGLESDPTNRDALSALENLRNQAQGQ